MTNYNVKPHISLGIVALLAANPLSAAIIINEVSPTSDRIELHNNGSTAVDISNWQFCSEFRYARVGDQTVVSGELNIPAGGYLVLEWPIDDTAADLGLYSSNAFNSTSAMQDFVQWGSGSNGRISVAASKGIWTSGTFVPAPTTDQSIIFSGGGTGSDSWSVTAAPSFGEANGGGVSEPSTTGWMFFGSYPYVWSDDEQNWLFLSPIDEGLWVYSFQFQQWTFIDQPTVAPSQ